MTRLDRINLQDHIRRLRKYPSEDDIRRVNLLRESLTTTFLQLETVREQVSGMGQFGETAGAGAGPDNQETFDDLDDDEEDDGLNVDLLGSSLDEAQHVSDGGGAANETPAVAKPVESRHISLPSNSRHSLPLHAQLELAMRMRQADRHLNALRDRIADKSFQYSHVIQKTTKTTVRSRARSQIIKMNNSISFHARVYSRCRLAMVRLGAAPASLQAYRALTKSDVKSSTALLTPNIPGSSSIQLSWIWQQSMEDAQGSPASLIECAFVFICIATRCQ